MSLTVIIIRRTCETITLLTRNHQLHWKSEKFDIHILGDGEIIYVGVGDGKEKEAGPTEGALYAT